MSVYGGPATRLTGCILLPKFLSGPDIVYVSVHHLSGSWAADQACCFVKPFSALSMHAAMGLCSCNMLWPMI